MRHLIASLLLLSSIQAAELVVPSNVTFTRDIEFANPDNQHLQVD